MVSGSGSGSASGGGSGRERDSRDSGGNSDGSCVSGSGTVVIVVVGVVVVVVVTHAQHLREGPPLQLQSLQSHLNITRWFYRTLIGHLPRTAWPKELSGSIIVIPFGIIESEHRIAEENQLLV